ncbi:phosphotransferase [Streptomyces sp. NPDC055056]
MGASAGCGRAPAGRCRRGAASRGDHRAAGPSAARRRPGPRAGDNGLPSDRRAGRRIHQASPPRPAPADSGPAVARADRRLAAARSHLLPGDEEFVRDLARQAKDLPPLEWVETHGDFQLRNILHDPDTRTAENEAEDSGPFVGVIDLERSEPGPAVRDLVRLSDAWHGRPDLLGAFLAGYGRPLPPAEQARLVIDAALDSVSSIAYGSTHADPELVERGRRTLARLRAEHHNSPSPAGEPR